ncbi:ERV1 [Candida oxycetoniae]|uniref:Sulfhydryl oxidase n=1 Tax=Candida oxycetoniae TaxID=497107 RepID=A0AAI9SXC7_9ASCO|nr:ERV1 [Candida oxycetoniae]KAI3404838.2 ERV1 [Candida oxycetoniae]
MSSTETKVASQEKAVDTPPKGLPQFGASGRRIIYDKDGKPCRACNTLLDFQLATGKSSKSRKEKKEHGQSTESSSSTIASTMPSTTSGTSYYTKVDPPDVTKLGRSSWSLLHSIAATYPEEPTTKQQQDMKSFLNLFAGFYPCWFCGEEFGKYMEKHKPDTGSQDDLGKWLCDAHNAVNKRLGKPKFDCQFWKKRWKDGWDEE